MQRTSMAIQVVFATPAGEEVVLDCVPVDGAGALPFTLRAVQSCSAAWVQAAIEVTLSRWADQGGEVELVLLDGAVGPEVRLSDGSARVQLPLTAAA